MNDINEADPTALLAELRDHAANGYKTCQYAAVTALVAERDEYKAGIGSLWKIIESASARSPVDQTIAEALTALVAERDGYLEGNKQTLRALEEANEIARRYKRERDEALDRVFAMDAMRKRVAELEARAKPVYITDGQRVESIDLRERLVCAIWPEIMRQWREYKDAIDPRGCARSDALEEADKMIAAMRKGDECNR